MDGDFPYDRVIPVDQWLGCLLAGAVGDALGGPVEFLSIADIRARFGPDGTTGYADAYGGRGKITDDTQLTLFTLEAMIRGHIAKRLLYFEQHPSSVLQHAYQRWLHTQGVPWHKAAGSYAMQAEPDGWLIGERDLFHRRAPGSTVLHALEGYAAGAERGTMSHRLNDSKGCGAVMRAAPCALWSEDPLDGFVIAAQAGALTHGHPSGYLAAGALAFLVHRLLDGAELPDAIADVRAELVTWEDSAETVAALDGAVALAERGRPSPEALAGLGGGWVGEEALAIGVCAALAADDLADGLLLAVNHSGDSDSTGSICGNLLGSVHGVGAIAADWLAELELRDVIERLGRDALIEFSRHNSLEDPEWQVRYPAW
ncbi:ADP-ribosylglycohydrolase family protein [Actinokineospora xionganensis]|uniref:ADP-ribosylglycohydrolase family protein n=1 Tax=Actinokineospora xionganensis TaxID=2684470 RepID=A0ABR7L8T7_9PSEU|nr:ADP-ribosylglycohydrolase family protein [Actinokineospora xionganensis]MBC6449111.1 ADP-ribosylglycohydrolase family protein [Actinokineospora xionganensis]